MAEHTNESTIESSGHGARFTVSMEAGSYGPSKIRKPRIVSLFKKSAYDEGSPSRIGGYARRKSSREKRPDCMETHNADAQQNVPEVGTASPVHHSQQSDEAESQHYAIQTQDQEQSYTGELSVKQFHKLNRQLVKERKSVDVLKKEKEVLESEKVKLKSENKSLERVLKNSKSDLHRMSKKQSQLSCMEVRSFSLEELRLKVIELEDLLAEKDHKITVLRLTHSNGIDGIEIDGENLSSGNRTESEGMHDSTAALERLLEEQNISLRLRKENADLRARILAMDTEIDKVHREINPSPKSPRKRSSAFFKRSKKSTSSTASRYASGDGPHDSVHGHIRSESPVMGKTESHQTLDASVSPLLSRANIESTTSLPCYASPNRSPQTPTRNKTDSDLETLQACLKLALSEKSFSEEKNVRLQKELDSAQGKIQELERALEAKTNKEMDKIQKSLTAAKIDRDTYLDELRISQQEVDEMVEKNSKSEKLYTDAKNKIKELEENVEALKCSASTSFSRSSTNISALKMPTPVSSPKHKVVSSTQKLKDCTSPVQQPSKSIESKTVPLDKTTSTSDTSRQEKVKELSSNLSSEKKPVLHTSTPVLHTSTPSRNVGELSRESSIDQFDPPKENTINSKGLPPPSPSHKFAKVSATRAMFEQKIDQTKINQSQARHSSKMMSLEEKRRFSMIMNSTSSMESKPTTAKILSKSNSYDVSARPHSVLKRQGNHVEKVPEDEPVRFDKSKSVSPASMRVACNGASAVDNEARNKINTAHKQQQENTPASSKVCVLGTSSPTSKAPENVSAASATKVSKITFTSTATSIPKVNDTSLKLARRESSPSALLFRKQSSPSMSPSPASSNAKTFISHQRKPGSVGAATARRLTPSSNVLSLEETSTALDKTVQSTVAKSQTQVKMQPPVHSWGKSDKQLSKTVYNSSVTTANTTTSVSRTSIPNVTTTTSSTPTPTTTTRFIPKPSPDRRLSSPVTRVGSIQNIQTYVNNSSKPTQAPTQAPTQNAVNSSESCTPSSSGIRRGPTHRALQRRERKDRPKTMFAGNPDTTNLVNLISKFQEEEQEKKTKDIRASMGSGLSSFSNRPSMNGTSLSSTSLVSGSMRSVRPAVTSSVSTIDLRQTNNRQRPLTFYGGDSSASSARCLVTAFNNNKPPAHAKLCRSQTVGVIPNNRMSKKAMLLRWCQIVTQSYENVRIENFAESFSNGLAFCAMMHHFIPDQVAFSTLTPTNREKNFKIAFEAAEGVGIPSLLDVEDMVALPIPDWMSVMTYVSFIYNKFGQENKQQPSAILKAVSVN